MTRTTEQAFAVETEKVDQIRRRNGFLAITVALLAVVAAGFGGWLWLGSTSDTALLTEIDEVLGDYYESVETNDVSTFDAITTDDVFTNQYYYTASADTFYADDSKDRDRIRHYVEFDSGWRVERHGAAIVIGEGPWYVSAGETWSNDRLDLRYEGIAKYVIVEQGERKKVGYYSYVGTASVEE